MSASDASISLPPHTTGRDRLVTALIFALLAHGVFLLGVGFVSLVPKHSHSPAVAVTLVRNKHVVPPPRRVEYLAQANQRGPGNTRRADSPEPPQDTGAPFPNPGQQLAEAFATQSEQRPLPDEDLQPLHYQSKAERLISTTATATPVPNAAASPTGPLRPVLIARLAGAPTYREQISTPAVTLPHIHGASPQRGATKTNALASVFAPYLQAWRAHIEAVGRAQFDRLVPKNVKRGHLTLAVSLNADGTIRSVQIVKRSHHPVLDAAALKIIRLAAPFPPFPVAVRRQTNILSFAYRWNFIRGGAASGTVGIGGG